MRTCLEPFRSCCVAILAGGILAGSLAAQAPHHAKAESRSSPSVPGLTLRLWRQPKAIASLDLRYGSGSADRAPHGPMTFVAEDTNGSNPKFVARDADGVKWKFKLGPEAQPETAATRLLWAVGYYCREDYFVPSIRVSGVRLRRGQNLIGPGGTVRNARLERMSADEKKIGTWKWKQNPLAGTREFNGLRVMMALVDNWDLKDDNNAVYQSKADPGQEIYMVSDVGATFGATHIRLMTNAAKNNVHDFTHASRRFVSHATAAYVSFDAPGRPSWTLMLMPPDYIQRENEAWIGQHVPRADVLWITNLLAQLTPEQLRAAFAGAGYDAIQSKDFSDAVAERIRELKDLRNF